MHSPFLSFPPHSTTHQRSISGNGSQLKSSNRLSGFTTRLHFHFILLTTCCDRRLIQVQVAKVGQQVLAVVPQTAAAQRRRSRSRPRHSHEQQIIRLWQLLPCRRNAGKGQGSRCGSDGRRRSTGEGRKVRKVILIIVITAPLVHHIFARQLGHRRRRYRRWRSKGARKVSKLLAIVGRPAGPRRQRRVEHVVRKVVDQLGLFRGGPGPCCVRWRIYVQIVRLSKIGRRAQVNLLRLWRLNRFWCSSRRCSICFDKRRRSALAHRRRFCG